MNETKLVRSLDPGWYLELIADIIIVNDETVIRNICGQETAKFSTRFTVLMWRLLIRTTIIIIVCPLSRITKTQSQQFNQSLLYNISKCHSFKS